MYNNSLNLYMIQIAQLQDKSSKLCGATSEPNKSKALRGLGKEDEETKLEDYFEAYSLMTIETPGDHNNELDQCIKRLDELVSDGESAIRNHSKVSTHRPPHTHSSTPLFSPTFSLLRNGWMGSGKGMVTACSSAKKLHALCRQARP